MRNFVEWLVENNAESNQINQMFSKAVSEIDKLFDWLHASLKRTLGGERGKIAVDNNSRKMAVNYLQNVLNILQKESDEYYGNITDSLLLEVDDALKGNFASNLGLQSDDGTYKAGDVLKAIKSRIFNVIDQLRNDIVLQSVGNLQNDLSGIRSDIGKMRSGEMNIHDDEMAKGHLQDILNSLVHNPNDRIFYKSNSGILQPLQKHIKNLNPNDEDSLYQAIRLIKQGGSSRLFIGPSAKDATSGRGKAVDLNKTSSVSSVTGRLSPGLRLAK